MPPDEHDLAALRAYERPRDSWRALTLEAIGELVDNGASSYMLPEDRASLKLAIWGLAVDCTADYVTRYRAALLKELTDDA